MTPSEYTRISRLHCTVSYNAEKKLYTVTDHSRNGTYIKGGNRLKKDKPTIVAPGTILSFADDRCSILLQ
jgi:hypothetical protein